MLWRMSIDSDLHLNIQEQDLLRSLQLINRSLQKRIEINAEFGKLIREQYDAWINRLHQMDSDPAVERVLAELRVSVMNTDALLGQMRGMLAESKELHTRARKLIPPIH